MNTDLHRELAYYLYHQGTLAELYDGQFVVIKNDLVLGIYDDAGWACPKTKKMYGGPSFFVQRVTPPTDPRPPAPTC